MPSRPGFQNTQDWAPTVLTGGGKSGGKGSAGYKKDLQQAARTGQVDTEKKLSTGANTSLGGHGAMGTTCGARAVKLENETEVFRHDRTGADMKKAMMQARTAKGW